ncbi:hypothetical protein DFP72DRAFT_1072895 [Ephemerocybe angulata]|uniref:Uncharacterized protein n=1 Tax=Ephemerocybe angulata TaxID=980116 RepID=A0A8H6M1C6_9AGAR|nr:hypothetical protein DFP72DRAFT_1072895 [Tulosesus angulatus]
MADISLDVIADGILLGTRVPWGSSGDSTNNVTWNRGLHDESCHIVHLGSMANAAILSQLHGTAASMMKAAISSILVPWPLPSSLESAMQPQFPEEFHP